MKISILLTEKKNLSDFQRAHLPLHLSMQETYIS